MKWKCMIVDDEPVAIRVLRQHLAKLNQYEVVNSATNALQAFEYLCKSPIDLLLLDIEMPELSGIQLFNTLENPPAIIFTTAHRNYAIERFELNAVDYLLKPISLPRLIKALDRFEHSGGRSATSRASEDYLFVTVDRTKRKICTDDIIYVESLKDYIRICMTDEHIITKETTSDFERRLPADLFLRIHRSFIINVSKIETVSYDEISLGKCVLPVGRSYKQEVMNTLGLD